MFDKNRDGYWFIQVWNDTGWQPGQAERPVLEAERKPQPACKADLVPVERLEEQICELAGHLTAATCRFLMLLADFDERHGWAAYDMSSCSAWLSWKCQMASGTAREHVRVARALRSLPVIRGEFGAGRLSYAKVRALTRIATQETDAGLAEMAKPMTGNQLERFARAHRSVTEQDDAQARVRRRLTWRFDDDGSLSASLRLPPLQGAMLLQALRAALGDLEHPHEESASAETAEMSATREQRRDVSDSSSNLADALVEIAEAFLGGKISTADNPDLYQVIVHAGTDVVAPPEPAAASAETPEAVSAETPETPETSATVGDPADPRRCHVEDGPAVSLTTGQMLACSATMSWMLHDRRGNLLDVGRRRRRPSAALRRAARERDRCRCRYPGCNSRRTDLHHVEFWRNGGRTRLRNLVNLCKYHHMLIHKHGYMIATTAAGGFTFLAPDGTPLPPSPALPETSGGIEADHDALITPETIIPPWYGERLSLDYAIMTCFANEAYQEKQRQRQAA